MNCEDCKFWGTEWSHETVKVRRCNIQLPGYIEDILNQFKADHGQKASDGCDLGQPKESTK